MTKREREYRFQFPKLRLAQLFAPAARLAAMLLVMLGAGGAWAAEPIASWTDFRDLTSGDYTWTVDSSCTIDPNTGMLTIGKSGGLYISRSGFGTGEDYTLTIAIDAEIPTSFEDDRTIVDILVNGNNRVSVAVNGTTMGQCWNTGAVSSTTYGKNTFPSGRQLYFVKYRGGSGTTTVYNNNNYIANNSDLMASNGKVWLLGVGCYNSANENSSISEVAEGMKIYSIRLYGSRITEAEVTADYNNYHPANSYLTLSGTDASWSTADWNNTSTPKSACYITVTEDTSLNIDTAVSVEKAYINVANGKTLTLTGVNSITATSGIYVNNGNITGGTIAVPNEGTLSGAVKVQGDAGITISGNSDSAGTVSIDVAEGKTLSLSASSLTAADAINLTGSGNVTPQTTIAAKVDIGSGVTVTANSGSTIRVSNFKGSGTIIFDGVLPSNAAAASSTVTASATDSSNWTGTLWLKNYNTSQHSGYPLYPHYWCHANSKLKFTNVAGYLPGISGSTKQLGYDGSELGEWIIEDDATGGDIKYGFTKTDGYSDYWIRFNKLSGSGTIAEASGQTQTPKIRIANGSEFRGTLKLDQGMRVAFSDSDVSIAQKQIVIAAGEEVTANSAWTTAGFVVNGTLNLNATPSGTVTSGTGTINLGSISVANGISGFASASAWRGKVVVPHISTQIGAIHFNYLGNSESTIVLNEIDWSNGVWLLNYAAEEGGTINPTIQVDGDVYLSVESAPPVNTTLSCVTGTGNLFFVYYYTGTIGNYHVGTLKNFSGSLGAYDNGNNTRISFSIGTLALDALYTPVPNTCLVNIDQSKHHVVNVSDTAVTIGGEATEYKLVAYNLGTATGGLYLAPAVIKASDGTLTPYESVDAAFTALSSLANDAYDYVAVYDSATVTFTDFYKTPKIKTVGEGVELTINSGLGDYGWVVKSQSAGVVTYSVGPIPADYTWVGAENAYWSLPASWTCGGVAANRAVYTIDNTIFTSDASVTIQANVSVASITNSAAVTFTAASDQTITVGDGGVVMTTLGNSITLSNVTLSKTPSTTAATLAVQITGGGDDPTVYTVVNSVASVDGVGYATLAEALALDGAITITLQQNITGDVTLSPGQTLYLNGKTVSGTIGGNELGVEIIDFGNMHMYYTCVDNRTNTWRVGVSENWDSSISWSNTVVPGAYTAVTIPATEGHATAITLSGDVSIKSLTLGAGETLTLSRSGETARTLTTSQAIVLTSGQSIVTNPGVTISPAITTDDANSYVKAVTSDGVTTYAVADHKATVYDSSDAEVMKYDSLPDAIAAATDGQKVKMFANSSDAITLNSKSIGFDEDGYTFTGTFTGNGTLVLGSSLSAAGAARWAAGWTGIVELKDITTVITDFDFADYGSANSTVRANNVLVRMPETGGEYGNVKEINLVGEGLRFGGDPIANQDFTFSAAISGTGKIRVGTRCQTASPQHTRYIFKGDFSDFAGGVDYNDTGYYKATIVFQTGADVIPSGNSGEWGEIILTANTTISLGGEMYGPAGIIVDGAINVLAGGSVRVDSPPGKQIQGSGTITYSTFPSSAPAFNNSWTGEVHLPGNTSIGGTNFGNWGKSGSKIVIDGDMAGWIAQNTSVTAELVLDGHNFTVNDFSPSTYSFSKISGSGTLSFNHKDGGYQPSSLSIGEVDSTYSGTINNNTTATLNISKISYPAGTVLTAGTKLLSTGGTGTIALGAVHVGGSAVSNITYSRDTAGASGDGFYVHSIATTTGDGGSAVTTVDTIDSSVAVTLDSSYTGKVVIPTTVTQLTITGASVSDANLGLKVTYTPAGGSATTDTYYGILSLDGSGNVSLKSDGAVTISGVEYSVDPELQTSSPITFASAAAVPTFSVKAIPGLWYQVLTGTSLSGGELSGTQGSGSAVQATSTTVAPVAPSFPSSGNVYYYKIAVSTTDPTP